MEKHIKDITEITYKSELTPTVPSGLIRRRLRYDLRSLSFRKSSAHLR